MANGKPKLDLRLIANESYCVDCFEPDWMHVGEGKRVPDASDPSRWRCKLCVEIRELRKSKQVSANPKQWKPKKAKADSEDETPSRACQLCETPTRSESGYCSRTCRLGVIITA